MLALTLWLTACGGDRASSDSIALDPSTDDETIVEGTELGSATQRWPRPLDTLDPDAPAQWGVDVLDRFPHDARAFTQGLEALGDGTLLESTGLRGESTIRVVDPTTGIVLNSAGLTDEEFGEGATVVDDTIGTFFNVDILPHTDFVATSLTKAISGEGDVMAGALTVNPRGLFAAELPSTAPGGIYARDLQILEH
ncbi:MAG: hypothetical protein EBZ17_13100, partial [Actinobacteria bacterium]|nr:hypothetical protein [Actinomycetota bacterium]